MNDESGAYEPVYTMTDWYDGPRGGIAEYRGRPHLYQSEFDYSRGYDDETFVLMPLDEETVRLALEDWEIWVRWEAAFKAGLTTEATHPALQEDRARHELIAGALAGRLQVDPARAIRARGDFRADPAPSGTRPGMGWTVRWTEA